MVIVRIFLGTNIFHLQNISALWAALDGTIARHLREGVSMKEKRKGKLERAGGCGNVRGRISRRTVSQIVTCESTGYPVHPAYCSSPKDLTMIGLSNVPTSLTNQQTHSHSPSYPSHSSHAPSSKHQQPNLKFSILVGPFRQAYLFEKHPKASYQKYPRPASFPRSQDARDQSLVRDR